MMRNTSLGGNFSAAVRVGIDLLLVREARQSLESGVREEFLGCRVDPDACQAGIVWHTSGTERWE